MVGIRALSSQSFTVSLRKLPLFLVLAFFTFIPLILTGSGLTSLGIIVAGKPPIFLVVILAAIFVYLLALHFTMFVSALNQGQGLLSLISLYRDNIRLWRRVLGLIILTVASLLIPVLPLLLLSITFVLPSGVALAVFYIIAAIVFAFVIMLEVMLILAPFIYITEGVSVIEAIRESIRYASGRNWLSIALRLLSLSIPLYLLTLILTFTSVLVSLYTSADLMLLAAWFMVVMRFIVSPLYMTVGSFLIYKSLKPSVESASV